MKKILLVMVMLSIFYFAFSSETKKKVNFFRGGNNLFYKIEITKKSFIRQDTIAYRVEGDLKGDIPDQDFQVLIEKSDGGAIVRDSLKLIKLFPPIIKEKEIKLWLENGVIKVLQVPHKKISWECILLYIYSLLIGPLLILI